MKIRLILVLLLSFTIFNGCQSEYNEPKEIVYSSINPIEKDVWICISPSAKKYHSRKCHGFNRCTHERRQVSESEAKRKNYTKCKICY